MIRSRSLSYIRRRLEDALTRVADEKTAACGPHEIHDWGSVETQIEDALARIKEMFP